MPLAGSVGLKSSISASNLRRCSITDEQYREICHSLTRIERRQAFHLGLLCLALLIVFAGMGPSWLVFPLLFVPFVFLGAGVGGESLYPRSLEGLPETSDVDGR